MRAQQRQKNIHIFLQIYGLYWILPDVWVLFHKVEFYLKSHDKYALVYFGGLCGDIF